MIKRLLISAIFIFLIQNEAFAAIAHDATTVNTSSTTTTGCSFTHTPVGTPTLVLLWIGLDSDEGISGTPTYAGVNMVFVDGQGGANSGDQEVWLYELHSPTAGAQTVAASFTEDNHHTCIAQTYTGTHATDATVESDTANETAAVDTISTTLTLNATTSWMVTFASWHGGDQSTVTGTNTDNTRAQGVTGTHLADDDGYFLGDSTGDVGSLTHTTDGNTDDEAAQVSVELIPAAAATRRIFMVS